MIWRNIIVKYEISCGAVVYTRKNDNILYVIVKSTEGYFGFPKGHMEKNETEEQTAIREIFEETGLKVNIIPGFKTINEYPIPHKEVTIKRVDRKSTRLNSSHVRISYAVFCLKKKK